jgi:hypothetical protein
MTIRRDVENCQLLIDEKVAADGIKECSRILLQLRRLKALEARVGIEPTHKGFADLYSVRPNTLILNKTSRAAHTICPRSVRVVAGLAVIFKTYNQNGARATRRVFAFTPTFAEPLRVIKPCASVKPKFYRFRLLSFGFAVDPEICRETIVGECEAIRSGFRPAFGRACGSQCK